MASSIEFLREHWAIFAAAGGFLCCAAVCVCDVLTVRRLRHEILKLKDPIPESPILRAIFEEMERFSRRYPKRASYLGPPFPDGVVKRFGVVPITLLISISLCLISLLLGIVFQIHAWPLSAIGGFVLVFALCTGVIDITFTFKRIYDLPRAFNKKMGRID